MEGMRIFLALCLLAPFTALADDDDGLPKPHPSIPIFPGYEITGGSTSDFGAREMPVGVDKDGDAKVQTIEGRYWEIAVNQIPGKKLASGVELFRNYKNAFEKKGGKVLFQQVDMGGGAATMTMPNGKGETWLNLEIGNGGEAYTLFIVERGGMQQKLEITASEMADALNSAGRVALYGILFDTGKDSIKPESEPLLDEVKKLLEQDKGLKLVIAGHTDNVGEKKANQALSQKRAAAVKAWLVKKGIDGKRLEEKGFGDSVPVADNRSEEGRAKNRRVELEKKK